MAIHFHNSLTRTKELFVPIDPSHVRFYVCGPTVYDRAHIGNARPVVVFDLLYRLLKHVYPKVTYVRNITDVDDKINARSQESGEPIATITARTINDYHSDMAALNALPPDIEPRATSHIVQMIAMIEELITRNHAYQANGHVLFSIDSMADYGKLSGRSLNEMIAGARIEIAPFKKNPADFVLWKPSSDDFPGWDSPWGRGRPGWHIECSAMSREYLGVTFDIHGGGHDLIFPHHENEIAQSVCAHDGKALANIWIHNGYLMVNGEKMSKSAGNFFTVNDLLTEAPGEAIRLCLLATHYHQPFDWTSEGLKQAKATLDRLYLSLRNVNDIPVSSSPTPDELPIDILSALEDDLNTPLAISHLHELATRLNKAGTDSEKAKAKAAILAGGAIMGIGQQNPDEWFRWTAKGTKSLSDEVINQLIAERIAARKGKNYSLSDQIRKQLADNGILLEDGPNGTKWRRS